MWGWREIFYVFAVPGVILSVLWCFLVTNSPADNKFCNEAERNYIMDETSQQTHRTTRQAAQTKSIPWLDFINRTKRVPRLETLRQVFTSRDILCVALGYGCMIGIANIFMSWIPTYLISVKGFTSVKVGFLASAPFLGAVCGNMLGGILSDRLLGGRRKPMMILGAFGTAAMTLLLMEAPGNAAYLGLILMASGLMLGIGYAGFSAYPMGLATKSTYPAAFGIVNSLGQLGGACAPLAAGILLDRYTWSSVFLYMVGTSLVCMVLLLCVIEPIAVEKECDVKNA